VFSALSSVVGTAQPVVGDLAAAGDVGQSMSDFYRSWLTVGIFGVIAAGFMALTLAGLGKLLRPDNPNRDKLTTYESGVDPVTGGWSQSQIRYYLFALLFVFFDVEAAFIFAWAIQVDEMGVYGLAAMGSFLTIIGLGLLYDWKKGLLRWV
jgi:NADH-quinone oxidoreductase subunit A